MLSPGQRGPSFIGKLGVRPAGEAGPARAADRFDVSRPTKSLSNTLYGGDRAGSRYYYVLREHRGDRSGPEDSGLINPGFKNKVTAMQLNPFVKFRGLEALRRRSSGPTGKAIDGDRRADLESVRGRHGLPLPAERSCTSARATTALRASSPASPATSGPNRWQFGGGWFVTPNVLAKVEYVNQKYFGYPTTNIRNGGQFKGFMLEGVVAF